MEDGGESGTGVDAGFGGVAAASTVVGTDGALGAEGTAETAEETISDSSKRFMAPSLRINFAFSKPKITEESFINWPTFLHLEL